MFNRLPVGELKAQLARYQLDSLANQALFYLAPASKRLVQRLSRLVSQAEKTKRIYFNDKEEFQLIQLAAQIHLVWLNNTFDFHHQLNFISLKIRGSMGRKTDPILPSEVFITCAELNLLDANFFATLRKYYLEMPLWFDWFSAQLLWFKCQSAVTGENIQWAYAMLTNYSEKHHFPNDHLTKLSMVLAKLSPQQRLNAAWLSAIIEHEDPIQITELYIELADLLANLDETIKQQVLLTPKPLEHFTLILMMQETLEVIRIKPELVSAMAEMTKTLSANWQRAKKDNKMLPFLHDIRRTNNQLLGLFDQPNSVFQAKQKNLLSPKAR